jgi:hypothetical protein
MAGFLRAADELGIHLMPWQVVAATYIHALGPDDLWLYPDVVDVVSRQQGKTELLLPFIVSRLWLNRRIMHTAQNRELPREVHGRVADFFLEHYPHLLKRKPRFANGQEEIRLLGGGHYRIVAPTRGGARGPANDDLIVDEARELDGFSFIAAANPTLQASRNPQKLWLSNAGDETSIVLNALRKRADEDPSLAYLEWSASPERDADDREGWLEANPAIGHLPQAMENLENSYRSYSLSGQMAIFETEHLCRWVPTMRPRLVDDFAWKRAQALKVAPVRRPSFGISYAPEGRASVVMAWREDAQHVALRELFDVEVDETGIAELGADALKQARRLGAASVGYDDATDRDLARQFTGSFAKRTKPVIGKDFQNATEAFVRGIESGTLRWLDGDHITADLAMTSRKDNDETGTYHAVRSKDDVPITAALAAIRAYWLASVSSPTGSLRIY